MDWAYTKNLLEDRFQKANRLNDRYLLVEPYVASIYTSISKRSIPRPLRGS